MAGRLCNAGYAWNPTVSARPRDRKRIYVLVISIEVGPPPPCNWNTPFPEEHSFSRGFMSKCSKYAGCSFWMHFPDFDHHPGSWAQVFQIRMAKWANVGAHFQSCIIHIMQRFTCSFNKSCHILYRARCSKSKHH